MGPGHHCFAKVPQVVLRFHLVQLPPARDVNPHATRPLPPNPLSEPCGTFSNIPGNLCLQITQDCSIFFLPRNNPKEFLCALCCTCVQRQPLVKPFHFSLTFYRLPETSSLFQWLREHLGVPEHLPRGNCDRLSLLPWI